MSDTDEQGREPGVDGKAIAKRAAFFVGIAIIAGVGLAALPGFDEVRDKLTAANPWWIVAVAVLRLNSMMGFVRALWSAFDRVMPFRRAVVLGFAEQGANVLLPAGGAGGPAFGAFVLRRLGVPGDLADQRHAALFLVTSAVSFVALALAGFGVALGLLPGNASLAATLLPAVLATVAITLAILWARSDAPEERERGRIATLLWRVRRFVHSGVRTTVALLRHGDKLLVVGAITYFACDVAALACCFEAFGGGAPTVGIFVIAYALGHAGALVPTPGGVGGTEGGLIGSFAAFGTPISNVAAAVLAYRVFQLGLPALFGSVALFRIQRVLAHPPPREVVAARFAEQRTYD